MSAPIDELLIAVRIEQGSNLMQLYEMLRELMGAGGGVNIEFPWTPTQQAWTGMITRLENLKDCCAGLHELIPSIKDELIAHIDTVINNLIAAIIDQFMITIENTIEPKLETFRLTLNELVEHIKVRVMTTLVNIIDKIRGVKTPKARFTEIHDRIIKLKKDIVRYGKISIEIKDLLTKQKFDELLGKNKELLEKIIANKEEFEPKVMEFLEGLEETIKGGDASLGDRLEQFMRDNMHQLLKWMPHEFSDYFLRVFHAIEKAEENILDRLGEPQERRRQVILSAAEMKLDIPEEVLKQEDIDMAVGTIENKVDEIYDRVEAIMEDVRFMFKELPTAKDISGLEKRFSEMESTVDKQFGEFLSDYFGTTDDLRRFAIRLGKITTERTEIRRIIEEYFDKALTKYEPILNENLQKLLEGEFQDFLNQLAAIIDLKIKEDEFEELEATEEELREKFPKGTIITPTDLFSEMKKYEQVEKLQEPTVIQRTDALLREILENRKANQKLNVIGSDVEEIKDNIKPTDEAQRILDADKAKAKERKKGDPII
jgi:hypothetical protein